MRPLQHLFVLVVVGLYAWEQLHPVFEVVVCVIEARMRMCDPACIARHGHPRFSYRSHSFLRRVPLSQPSFMRRVQFQLSQPSFMRRVQFLLSQPSFVRGMQFQLSQPSFMRRVQFQLSQPSFMRRVLSFSLILYLCVLVSRILLDLAKLLYFCFYDGFSNFCRGIGKLVFSRTIARAPFHARLFVLVFTTMLQSRLQQGYGRALLPGPFRLTQRVISIKEA
jgi:hypothetical protein